MTNRLARLPGLRQRRIRLRRRSLAFGAKCGPSGMQSLPALSPPGRTEGSKHLPLLDTHHRRALAPQPLDVVVGTLLRGEDVDDHVAEVQQHPPRIQVALAAKGAQPVPAQGLVQNIQKGLHLADVDRRGDNEVIGESRDLADVEKQDILSLPLGQQVNDAAREVRSSQKASSELELRAL